MSDALSWWATTTRESFTAVAEARTFAPVDGLHRVKTPTVHIQTGAETTTKRQRVRVKKPSKGYLGTAEVFTDVPKTHCPCGTAIKAYHQAKGIRRCEACRKQQPGQPTAGKRRAA